MNSGKAFSTISGLFIMIRKPTRLPYCSAFSMVIFQ